MRYQIRALDFPKTFELYDWQADRVAYRGRFEWVRAMSQLLNYEDMRVRGEIGGSVPQVWRLWPRDWRSPDTPMPPE